MPTTPDTDALALDHRRKERRDEQQRSPDVDRVHGVDELRVELDGRQPSGGGGVVHEDVDAVQCRERSGRELDRSRRISEIGEQDHGSVIEVGRDLVECFAVSAAERDPSAGAVEGSCGSSPDAP